MLDTKSPLIAEFLKDHQQFSRLLVEIANLLDRGEVDKARQRADELDQVAGPHIAYEETELYPRLKALGAESVTHEELAHEHHDMVDALRMLLQDTDLDDAALAKIHTGFHEAIDHAEHCGTLITLVTRLDEDEREKSLQKLLSLRKGGRRWTDM